MAITLVSSGKYEPSTGNGYTTDAQNVSGSPTFLIVWMAYQGGSTPTLSDNKSNSYTAVDPVSSAYTGDAKYIKAFYAWSGVTGGSDLTFTVAGSGIAASLHWQAYTGTRTSSDPYVTKTDAANFYLTPGSFTSIQPGAITATSGNLLTIGLNDWIEEETGPTINSSFTRLNFTDYQNVYAAADAYKISAGASDNPTWTMAVAQDLGHVMMIEFAAAAASQIKTKKGLAIASVKTFKNLATASVKSDKAVTNV